MASPMCLAESGHRIDCALRTSIASLHRLNQELRRAWENEERVKTLKIAIQCAKVLGDISVIKFYPSKWTICTEILDTFGRLVYERIWDRATQHNPATGTTTYLPGTVTPQDGLSLSLLYNLRALCATQTTSPRRTCQRLPERHAATGSSKSLPFESCCLASTSKWQLSSAMPSSHRTHTGALPDLAFFFLFLTFFVKKICDHIGK